MSWCPDIWYQNLLENKLWAQPRIQPSIVSQHHFATQTQFPSTPLFHSLETQPHSTPHSLQRICPSVTPLIFHSASSSQLKILDRIQAKALRLTTGATSSTPHIIFESDTLTSPLSSLILTTLHRVRSLPTSSFHPASPDGSTFSFQTIPSSTAHNLHLSLNLLHSIPSPPLFPPWKQHLQPFLNLPSQRRVFKQSLRKHLRAIQQQNFLNSSHLSHPKPTENRVFERKPAEMSSKPGCC
jgi:hypothetical protein